VSFCFFGYPVTFLTFFLIVTEKVELRQVVGGAERKEGYRERVFDEAFECFVDPFLDF
jgi:hypothetical protein